MKSNVDLAHFAGLLFAVAVRELHDVETRFQRYGEAERQA